MIWKSRWFAIFVSLILALSTAQAPSFFTGNGASTWSGSWSVEVAADDDDDDDDDWDDDDWDDDDCDDDDCFVPAPVVHDRTYDTPVYNQAILQLTPGSNAESFAAEKNSTVLAKIGDTNVILLEMDTVWDDQAEVTGLLTDERVMWAEQNFTSHAPEGRPRYFFTSSALTSGFVDAPALPQELNFAPQAACVDGTGYTVAVLDTGVDVTHPLLEGKIAPGGMNTLDGTDDIADDGNGLDDDADGLIDELVGHGTHVAGGIVQVAPDAQIMPFKALNSDGVGTTFSVTSAIYLAVESDVDVINLSLGSTHDSLAIRMAVEFAIENDVIVVAAAGNSNLYSPVEYPAAMDSVISVASVNALGDKSAYSNFHESVSISAPGENVASAYPDSQYLLASGTSMATPMVSGTIVLMLERYPESTPSSVIQSLHESSSPLSLNDPLLEGLMGSGSLDINTAIDCEPEAALGWSQTSVTYTDQVAIRIH